MADAAVPSTCEQRLKQPGAAESPAPSIREGCPACFRQQQARLPWQQCIPEESEAPAEASIGMLGRSKSARARNAAAARRVKLRALENPECIRKLIVAAGSFESKRLRRAESKQPRNS